LCVLQIERTVTSVASDICAHFGIATDTITHVRDRAFNDRQARMHAVVHSVGVRLMVLLQYCQGPSLYCQGERCICPCQGTSPVLSEGMTSLTLCDVPQQSAIHWNLSDWLGVTTAHHTYEQCSLHSITCLTWNNLWFLGATLSLLQ
jgi:hypothetical protein